MDLVVFYITKTHDVHVNYPSGVGTTWYGPYDTEEDAVVTTRARIDRLIEAEVKENKKRIRKYSIERT